MVVIIFVVVEVVVISVVSGVDVLIVFVVEAVEVEEIIVIVKVEEVVAVVVEAVLWVVKAIIVVVTDIVSSKDVDWSVEILETILVMFIFIAVLYGVAGKSVSFIEWPVKKVLGLVIVVSNVFELWEEVRLVNVLE